MAIEDYHLRLARAAEVLVDCASDRTKAHKNLVELKDRLGKAQQVFQDSEGKLRQAKADLDRLIALPSEEQDES